MNDIRIRNIIDSGEQTNKGLDLLENRPTVGSLSESDQFASEEMERFWLNSRNIQESSITGCETFPGEMLTPKSDGVLLSGSNLDLIVEFYTATYELYDFRKPADELIQDSVTIRVKMDQFGRCRIGSEIFGSKMSMRHVKSSYILANFLTTDGQVDCYPGQVQYYFKHVVDLPNGPTEHNLAYVRWYKPAETANNRYHFSIDDETCNVELWRTDFYPESRDCIIPVHNILCRFVPVKYQISTRRNAVKYLAINAINRKLHIR
jgi:hypothetical protein